MSERRFFHFAYPTRSHKDRLPYPFQLRDGEAALFLFEALSERGYRFAGPIVNYPPGPDVPQFDVGLLRETDLILLTTRPPLDDSDVGDKKSIPPSYTKLEEELFKGPLRKRFKRCARSEIVLTEETAAISGEIAKRQSMIFRQNRGSTYQAYGSPVTREWRRFKRPDPLTAAFLLYDEHAWPQGPALLAAFGTGGNETLGWCYQLATRFEHLLFTTPFAMAELRLGPLAPRPTSMHFADKWEVTLLGVAPQTCRAARVDRVGTVQALTRRQRRDNSRAASGAQPGTVGTFDSVESRVRWVVAEQFGVNPEELKAEISLTNELAADSLDLLDMVLALEGEFDIAIPETRIDQIRTYGDVLGTVQALTRRRRQDDSRAASGKPAVVWARIVSPRGAKGDVQRVALLTPNTAQTIADDALRAGRGVRLELAVPPNWSDAALAALQDQFAWLGARGVQVSVRRDQHLGSIRERARRPDAA